MIQNSTFSRELEVCKALATEAGELAIRYRDGDLRVEMKAGDEPVTAADKAASEHIVAGLSAAFPDDIIISEENTDDLRRLTAERVWYIDPIDGTKDFIRGEEGFCVMIGLAIDHKPTVGVIYQPTGKRVFAAAPDIGTWVIPPEGEPSRVHVADTSDPSEVRLVASKSHRSPAIDEVKSALGIANELNVGSVGLKLSLIAVAERDLYVNPTSKCKLWDTCGPEALLHHAGGRLSDVHGNPLQYDSKELQHPRGLVASNSHVHDAVIAKLAPLFPADKEMD